MCHVRQDDDDADEDDGHDGDGDDDFLALSLKYYFQKWSNHNSILENIPEVPTFVLIEHYVYDM